MAPEAISPVELTVHVLAKKWKPTIITLLAGDSRRFNRLHKALPGVSHKVLIEQLRELEKDGIVRREAKVGGYKRVHYSLTAAGERLLPILDSMAAWGREQARQRGPPGARREAAPIGSELDGA